MKSRKGSDLPQDARESAGGVKTTGTAVKPRIKKPLKTAGGSMPTQDSTITARDGSLHRRVRPPVGSPDAAQGTVSCIGCLAWPTVYRMSGGYWVAFCLGSCDRCVTGRTRQDAVDEWNERNRR